MICFDICLVQKDYGLWNSQAGTIGEIVEKFLG